jgi:5-methylcytosine-specific restriction endonuclease McrA
MNSRDIKDALEDILSLSEKLSKKVNKFEKRFHKVISVIYEISPSNNRYIPKSVRQRVLIRDRYRCVKCSSQKNLQFDHIVAIRNGGSNTVDNVQVLCSVCNLRKGVS